MLRDISPPTIDRTCEQWLISRQNGKKRDLYLISVEISILMEEDLENFIFTGLIQVKCERLKTTLNILSESEYVDSGTMFMKNNKYATND